MWRTDVFVCLCVCDRSEEELLDGRSLGQWVYVGSCPAVR